MTGNSVIMAAAVSILWGIHHSFLDRKVTICDGYCQKTVM